MSRRSLRETRTEGAGEEFVAFTHLKIGMRGTRHAAVGRFVDEAVNSE